MNKRYIGLDIFRIMSCVIVCAYHTTIHLGCDYGLLNSVSIMGAVFMTAFFMLSGVSLYVNYKNVDFGNVSEVKKFFLKRMIGVMPLYYICSMIFIILFDKGSILEKIIIIPLQVIGIQSMFSSLWAVSHHAGTWFISCIIICYLFYPYIQHILKQLSVKK